MQPVLRLQGRQVSDARTAASEIAEVSHLSRTAVISGLIGWTRFWDSRTDLLLWLNPQAINP
jgi:hypothetical protein